TAPANASPRAPASTASRPRAPPGRNCLDAAPYSGRSVPAPGARARRCLCAAWESSRLPFRQAAATLRPPLRAGPRTAPRSARSASFLQLVLELLEYVLAQLGRGAHHRRKLPEHLPRPARVDDGARVPRDALRQARVERAAPVAPDEVDVLGGIAARAHRPQHLVEVGGIDVVVHHDHEA